jgi:uncharacterized protein with von Willebrand factor type A (vWA) domain
VNHQVAEGRLVGFINYLRQEGYTIGIQETLDSLRALHMPPLPDEDFTRHVLRTLTCRDHAEWLRFDQLFQSYWFPGSGDSITTATSQPKRSRRGGGIAGIGGSSREYEDTVRDLGDMLGAGAGRQHTITKTDFRFLSDRLAAREAERLAERLAERWHKRLKRRSTVSRHGKKIDMRKTLRGNARFGGLPVNPLFTRRRREPPHIILLHDVSHSMAWNNPLLFRFARGLVRTFPASEAFAFHTHLFRVTALYRERSLEVMRQRLEARNHLWLGGTCIADSLRYFLDHYGRQLLRPHTVVLILSDGFDTNDPGQLGLTMKSLKSRVKKIFWLNPMLGRETYRPDDDFMRLVAPAIDQLAPAHSVAALEKSIDQLVRC